MSAKDEVLAIPLAIREAVDLRDGTHCRVCGKYLGERRALHHILFGGDVVGMGGRRVHNAEQIVTICWLPGDPRPGMASCHETVHSQKLLWQPLLLAVVNQPRLTALALRRQGARRLRRRLL